MEATLGVLCKELVGCGARHWELRKSKGRAKINQLPKFLKPGTDSIVGAVVVVLPIVPVRSYQGSDLHEAARSSMNAWAPPTNS